MSLHGEPNSLAIEARGLCKTYPSGSREVQAVRDIDLNIAPGDFVAIVGPSGSGKSTLLYLLGTLEKPTSGEVLIGGVNVTGLKARDLARLRREKMGFVFQQYNLLPALTALENVMLPLMPYQRRSFVESRAKELLEVMGLGDRMNHLPSMLSGGEQQRVAIARALLAKPEVILADEPTGNLDSRSTQDIVDLMKKINREEGVTLALVTHNMGVAEQANRVLRMKDGRIIDPGP